MMSFSYTAMSWAGIGAVAGLYYFAARRRRPQNVRPVAGRQINRGPEARNDTKGKKPKNDGTQSSGDQDPKTGKKSSKKKGQQSTKPGHGDEAVVRAVPDTIEDGTNNLEFAHQMSSAQTGKLSAPKSETASRPKAVKQSRATEKPVAESSTGPSSTTGADADDDQSPINSPDLSATTIASPVTNGDVSDMLEKPSSGPSVLRVTSPTNPVPAKKTKPQTFEAVETKKQRQNRKKAEAAKLQREEDEKERKALMEKQRRTAREAEGRAAKDGSSFMAARAPSSSAWTSGSPPVNGSNTPTTSTQLLDTLEASASKPTATVPVQDAQSTGKAGSDLRQASAYNLPEEEQLKMVAEESADSEWNVVESTKKKRKGNKTDRMENKDPKEETGSSTDEQSDSAPAPVTAPTRSPKKFKIETAHFDTEGNIVKGQQIAAEDAEWDVS